MDGSVARASSGDLDPAKEFFWRKRRERLKRIALGFVLVANVVLLGVASNRPPASARCHDEHYDTLGGRLASPRREALDLQRQNLNELDEAVASRDQVCRG
jgi:hypothetical protein